MSHLYKSLGLLAFYGCLAFTLDNVSSVVIRLNKLKNNQSGDSILEKSKSSIYSIVQKEPIEELS